ncbi:hypothetical protein [Micromonospora marina]|uniref:hypothetical protein n=1 Tax=Micromonospora marina TaxID=307120 RepID=UPI003D70B037
MERVRGLLGRPVAVHAVDETLRRHGAAGVEQQQHQQRAQPPTGDGQHAAVGRVRLGLAEHTEPHAPDCRLSPPRRWHAPHRFGRPPVRAGSLRPVIVGRSR